jgi:hypothetical protein
VEITKIMGGIKAAILFAENMLGPRTGSKKLHVAVSIVQALAQVGLGMLPPGVAGDVLAITNVVQQTVQAMNQSGELGGIPGADVVSKVEEPKPQPEKPTADPSATVKLDLSKFAK